MTELTRAQIRDLMGQVMKTQGGVLPDDDTDDDTAELRQLGFRSLDFSELALRVEDELGTELNFDAARLRRIATVGDVLDFLEQLQKT
jgi:acyl carrier protein